MSVRVYRTGCRRTLPRRRERTLPNARVTIVPPKMPSIADRLAALHIPVVQINTDAGFGGECHLDANMVRSALGALPLTVECVPGALQVLA